MKPIYQIEKMIPFALCDSAGILFFARIFDLYHQSLEDYLSSLGLWSQWFSDPEVAVPLKNISCDYRAPLQLGEKYDFAILPKRMGEHSLLLIFQVKSLKDQSIHAHVEALHVFINKTHQNKIPISNNIKKYFNE